MLRILFNIYKCSHSNRRITRFPQYVFSSFMGILLTYSSIEKSSYSIIFTLNATLFCCVSFHEAAIPILGQLHIVDPVITKFAKMPSQACLRNRRSFAKQQLLLEWEGSVPA